MQTTGSADRDGDGGQDPALVAAREWLEAAARELGLDPASVPPLMTDLLDLTRDVAHGPSRPAAPLTAFLVGLAAGRTLPADSDRRDTGEMVTRVREHIAVIGDLLAEHARQRDDGGTRHDGTRG